MSLKKTILLVVVAIVLLAGGGAAGFFARGFLENRHKSGEEVVADPQKGGEKKAEEKAGHGEAKKAVAELDPFVVNLADHGVKRRYLRITLHLSLRRETDKESLKEAAPRIRDAVLTLLSSKRAGELLTVEGKTQLRGEIAEQINTAIGEEAVATVYFVDFLIQ